MRLMMIHAPSPIVREFCRRGYEIVSCNSNKSFDSQDSLPAEWGPKQRTIDFYGRKKVTYSAIKNVARIAREFQPDLIHAFIPNSLAWSVLGTAGMRRPPKIISYRGITRVPTWFDPADWITYLSPRVSLHACESRAVQQAMMRGGIPESRCRVVYNAMWDFEDKQTRREWRAGWGVDDDTLVIGTVGHIRPVKGVDVLLEAASKLPATIPWKLLLGGVIDDPNVTRWMQHDALRGRVIAPGPISPAASAMKAFDLFVMPSRSEGLCRALIEATTVGVAAVVSDAGGMKELVRDHQDGLVVPKENAEALRAAMLSLLVDPEKRLRMGKSASEHTQSLCSTAVVADKLQAMYEEVV
ncbi:MAG: glycosyltransferase family 4 protein [Pirellula sp.]